MIYFKLEWCRIDLEQNVTQFYRHVRLDWDLNDLAAHVRRYLDDPPGHGNLAGRRQIIEQRQECGQDEGADR